jgi:DNA methylase
LLLASDIMHGQLAVMDQTRLDVVSARNDSEQAGIGWCLVIGILDQHAHFATDALQAHRHRQSQEIIRCSFRAGRTEEMALHPTVKPAALVADAIKDCSRRGDIVLDPFGGSGTTLIASQKSGRRARLIEYDPAYCDVIVRRFEATTGDRALLAKNRQSFEDVAEQRIGSPDNTKSNRFDQNPELLGVVSQ